MIPPYFNPSNDMALAANVRQYLPPRRIQQMESDLADLAQLWDEGPWGWSLATKQHYLRLGIDESELPSDMWLQHVRRLSSREFACQYIARLLASEDWGGQLVGDRMHFCHTVEEAQPDSDFFASQAPFGAERSILPHSAVILKSPWSSSGRGIVVARDGLTPDVIQRAQGMLRTQGGFLIDRFYTNKAVDFAMEFNIDSPGHADFLGYSVFRTAERGAYSGNVVASQDELLRLILEGTSPETQTRIETLLSRLVCYHQQHLGTLGYTGPVGIDMMRLADGRLHPVVEINLRRNMGILALQLYRQGLTYNHLLASGPCFSAAVENHLLVIRC